MGICWSSGIIDGFSTAPAVARPHSTVEQFEGDLAGRYRMNRTVLVFDAICTPIKQWFGVFS
jgi:hypothetical protein